MHNAVEEKNSCFLCRQPSLWMLQGEVSNITGLPSDLETHLLMEKHPDLLPVLFLFLFLVKFIYFKMPWIGWEY